MVFYLAGRVPTVREKSVKNEKSSRSGKRQGIFNESGKFEIKEKVREKSGNFIATCHIFFLM